MQTESVTRKKPSPILVVALGLIVIALGLWLFFSIRESRRWNDYLTRLNAQPGIVVVSAEKRGGKYHITGLRDPMAADPASLLAPSSIDQADVVARWESYQTSDPDIVLARFTRLLEPPPSVSLTIKDGVLVARGAASHDWINSARKLVQIMPSVNGFAEEGLVDLDLARTELGTVTQRIEGRAIRFGVGSPELTPDQRDELNRVVPEIQRLSLLARSLGAQSRVEVWGHADQSGSQELNDRLIAARAEQVVSALSAMGVPSTDLVIADPKASSKLRDYTRTATFKVKLSDSAGVGR